VDEEQTDTLSPPTKVLKKVKSEKIIAISNKSDSEEFDKPTICKEEPLKFSVKKVYII
jgi:hypothetical protein